MSAEAAYQKRVSSGFYDEVYQKLQDLNPFLLANLTWDTDFKHDPTYAREFIHTSDGQRFSTFIFGEIAPASDGTIHSALGNHFIGTSPKYVSCRSIWDNADIFSIPSSHTSQTTPNLKTFLCSVRHPLHQIT